MTRLLTTRRIASVTIEIPEPEPTGRADVETDYSVMYRGIDNVISIDYPLLQSAIREFVKRGTCSATLIAYEYLRDYDGDPLDLLSCQWEERANKWTEWEPVKVT